MKILILGHGGHGKDKVAEMILKNFNLSFESSSRAALEHIWPVLEQAYLDFDCDALNPVFKNKEDAFEKRSQYRELWRRCISLYNAHDKSALCRKILETSDIYVGMRCDQEYQACKDLFDLILWVDRSKYIDREDSMKIEFDISEMILINNNRKLYQVEPEVCFWVESFLNEKTS
jgi:hypothetical protein